MSDEPKKILNDDEFKIIFGTYTVGDMYKNISLIQSVAQQFYNNFSVDSYGNFTVRQAASVVTENLATEE